MNARNAISQRGAGAASAPDAANNTSHPIQFLRTSQLLLDEENPRLFGIGDALKSQAEIVRALWDKMAVSEVALSIAANGYFVEEPMFVVRAPRGKRDGTRDQYTVVEGNRRLAAVMLLRDADLRRQVRATDLPRLSPTAIRKLDHLPVSIYENREQLWQYFGFRHVNGPKEWDSLSKAAYIALVRHSYGVTLEKIADSIGDQHKTVERFYRGYVLLEQAEAHTDFTREDVASRRLYFSHLYTAADQREFQEFLGLTPQNSLRKNPVQKAYLENLHSLMVWLFGSRRLNAEPLVRTQNPDLNRLREILGSRKALHALQAGTPFEVAHKVSQGDERLFEAALYSIKEHLGAAMASVATGYAGDKEKMDLMDDILQNAQALHATMTNKNKK